MIAPKLRFREFTDEWKSAKISDLVESIVPPIKLLTKDFRQNGAYPIVDQGKQLIAGYTNNRKSLVVPGEYIIFGDHTETLKFVDFPFAQGADGIKILRTTQENISPRFLYYGFLRNYIFEGNYKRHWTMARETKIAIPSLNEQIKIAKFLSAVDARIDAASRKLELLRDYEKAVSQKIFSREIRFPEFSDEWKPAKISNLVESIVPPIKILTKDFHPNGAYPIVDQGKQLIAGYTDDKRALIGPGKYVIFGDHTETLKFVDFPFTQGADGLKILRVTQEDISPKFLYYGFSRNYIFEGNYKRHWSTARETMIAVPSLNEQIKIANLLSSIDNEISVERVMISEMKRFKKALLQRMLV